MGAAQLVCFDILNVVWLFPGALSFAQILANSSYPDEGWVNYGSAVGELK